MPVPTARQKTGARNSSRPLPSRGGRAKRRTRPAAGRDAKVRGLLVEAGRLMARGNGIRGSEVAAGVGKRRIDDDVIDVGARLACSTEEFCLGD